MERYSQMNVKQHVWKTLVTPLFVAGVAFSASLFGLVGKVEAQITQRDQAVFSFLTSSSGRWVEIEPGIFDSCYIYDFKPSGVPGILRIIREQYPRNNPALTFGLAGPCRFGFPLGGSRQSVGAVRNNGNTLVIRFASGFVQQIQLAQFDTRQQRVLVQKNNLFTLWQRL